MPPASSDRPILEQWPVLSERLPMVPLGALPTPVEPLRLPGFDRDDLWIKRDDVTSPIYGGNKVRTLEVLFGQAKAAGATHVYSTGAFGSNHAAATVLHAPRVGLRPGVVLFPQPESPAALENLRVILGARPVVRALFHWSALPFGMFAARRAHARAGERAFVMVPGGATPTGALGYVSAAFELARQVADGELPRPAAVVVGAGSTCTSAGLLLGFHLAARRRVGFVAPGGAPAPPRLVSVRVTPWPITSPIRIARLAVRTARLLAELTGDASLAVTYRALRPGLEADGRFLGRGYGHATPEGLETIELFRAGHALELDTTYSAKAAAALVSRARDGARGPLLFWSTKSTVPLPTVRDENLTDAPPMMRRWMERASRRGRDEPALPGRP